MTLITPTRAAVVAHARAWIGTPYHHQASRIGVGTDCLGLIRGVFRALYGHEAQSIPGYARDWAEGAGEETMLAAARRHLIEVAPSAAAAGDVLIFRYRHRYVAKHAAILAGPTLNAPAYRGVAYIVFERMPLQSFGNRLPQLSFEIYRAVDPFEAQVRGVVLIPGSGEFVYATGPVTRSVGLAQSETENTHTRRGGSDWTVALDQLQDTLPNAGSVSLVVSWFGTDLRAGECLIRPCVDTADKDTSPIAWGVAGLDRSTASVVSSSGGRAAYGGTPSDQTVVGAIQDLTARGLGVTLTPFILMDTPAGNALPDPYTGDTGQPAYPWRGRITVDPAPGQPGSPDKSAGVTAQLAAFIGTATPADFSVAGETVLYSGPAEWSLRRMVLHYAHLAAAAGGVDAFIIGSELRGLTQIRSDASTYPFVAALASLADDVKAVIGPGTRVTYAADWSEYFGHQPADETGDVFFHLDPLWASPSIDAVAIDLYWPLSDYGRGTPRAAVI